MNVYNMINFVTIVKITFVSKENNHDALAYILQLSNQWCTLASDQNSPEAKAFASIIRVVLYVANSSFRQAFLNSGQRPKFVSIIYTKIHLLIFFFMFTIFFYSHSNLTFPSVIRNQKKAAIYAASVNEETFHLGTFLAPKSTRH